MIEEVRVSKRLALGVSLLKLTRLPLFAFSARLAPCDIGCNVPDMNMLTWALARKSSILIALVAVAFMIPANASASTAGSAAGELVITRSFALAGLPVDLMIDGKRAATILFNRNYRAPIAAGWHTLKVLQVPVTQRSRSGEFHLQVEQGKTYRFTATRVGPEVLLRQVGS